MANLDHRPRATGDARAQPPVAGMPPEVWSWLHESIAVRPHVVAAVKARLDAGDEVSADAVAVAMLLSVA